MSLVAALLWGLSAAAVAPVQERNRFEAAEVRVLAAPDDKPMHMPTDVAIDGKGRVYVADGASDRIVRFAADGKFESAFSEVSGQKLRRPVGIAVDSSDRLWIADTGNHRVLVTDAELKTVEAIELPKLEGGHEPDPTDIVVTADLSRAYVVDNENQRILIRDNKAGTWKSMGKMGRALGQFQWPFMICLGAEQYVYITEVIGARVQQISPSDRWAGEFGTWGVELGQLYRPKGIAVDARGKVYVSDSSLGVVQVFSQRGTFEGVLTDAQGKPYYLKHPMGICFDSQGRLAVVELAANRVVVLAVAGPGQKPTTRPAEKDGK